MLAAFDLDGTLVDQAAAARAWTKEFVEALGLPGGAVDEIASTLSERRPKGPLFDELVAKWHLSLSGDDVAAAYRRRMPQLVRCTEADKQALAQLRAAGWTIGIVTNGTVENQEGKIRATGLADLVDGWVVSEAVDVRKPDPAIFRALAQHLRCDLQGWIIGDSLEHDVAGGAAAGLNTAWVSSSDPLIAVMPEPTIRARTAADAVALIFAAIV